jgi:glycosyltransferase involved in cell wall biosynthesis
MIEQTGQGGIADYTAELTRALAAEGWQIELATAQDHRYAPAPGVRIHPVFHYMRGRTRLARAARARGLGPLANGLRFLLAIPRLMALARRVDIVHAQKWELAPLGLVAVTGMRIVGATVVQTAHNTFERGLPFERTNRLLDRLTARTIVHTEADLERLSRVRGAARGGVRRSAARRGVARGAARGGVAMIPHGEYGGLAASAGLADRDAARAELGIAREAPVTLLFGHLRLDKGLDDLLAALPRVPGLQLLVGGREEGALAAARAQLQRPELAARVTVREGFLELPDLARLFAAADTVALPYARASQSGVLLLAYGFQRPVVAYPVGGLVEAVLDGETGWLCARPDVDGLAQALAASVAAGWPECRRRGAAGARLAAERFAWPAIARRTGELYEQALAHGATVPPRG